MGFAPGKRKGCFGRLRIQKGRGNIKRPWGKPLITAIQRAGKRKNEGLMLDA